MWTWEGEATLRRNVLRELMELEELEDLTWPEDN